MLKAAHPLFVSTILWAMVVCHPGASHSAEAEWPFPHELRSRLVFCHPLVNYSINPIWQRDWERQLARASGVQITVGSVATEELYTDLIVNITEPLGHGFRFLYRTIWREGLHLDLDRQEHWLGFELAVLPRVATYLQVHPTADKEEFDLLAGLLVTDLTRERYLRLGLRLDDFMYEKKNDLGGISIEEPVSIQWELRYQSDRWEFFSTGRYGSGSRRVFPGSIPPPSRAESFTKDGASTARLRYIWSDLDFAGYEVSHYLFNAAEQRHDELAGFDYANEYVHQRALGVFGIGGSWGLRPEVHWLRQWASSQGRRQFNHLRQDIFPALFVELRTPGNSTWEAGYLASHHQWEYSVGNWVDEQHGYTDKIKLGWTYSFQPTSRLQFSLSHELNLKRFGGGNVQYQMNF